MIKERSYAVIGTGAVGGYYGALLHKSGREVYFLLHRDYEKVKERGLRVDSVGGDFVLSKVNAYGCASDMPPCDVVLVALKATNNGILPRILPSVCKKGGTVLLMQNGLGGEEEIAGIMKHQTIVGGLCFICSSKIGPGHIQHLDYGDVTLGEYTVSHDGAGITGTMKMIAEDFVGAGIKVHLVDNLEVARWKKLVWNVPFNGLSVVLDATTDQLMKSCESRSLIIKLMEEVCEGAAACGNPVEKDFIDTMVTATDTMTSYTTSMKIDYERKRPLEIEAIYGVPLEYAKKAGATLPYTTMLYHQLKFLDRQNSAGV